MVDIVLSSLLVTFLVLNDNCIFLKSLETSDMDIGYSNTNFRADLENKIGDLMALLPCALNLMPLQVPSPE